MHATHRHPAFTSWSLAAVLALAVAATPARAADAVTDALKAAYAPYREALFRTNSKAQPESEAAMVAARAAWKAVGDRYGTQTPAPYDRDSQFGTTLAQVDTVYTNAAAQVAAHQLPQAHETLEEARDLMAELRRRNGVIVYSDHMNAYHAVMEQVLLEDAKKLGQPGGMHTMTGQAAVLNFLAQRLSTEAPADVVAQPGFKPLVDAVLASVAGLRAAVERQDEAAVRAAVGQLKAPYSRLFLTFG